MVADSAANQLQSIQILYIDISGSAGAQQQAAPARGQGRRGCSGGGGEGEPDRACPIQQQRAVLMAGGALSGEAEGVLLYYAYRDLRQCQAEVRDWYKALCRQQGLVGCVRVALDGLNVTVGGSLAALRQHIDAVEESFGREGGAPIDFKLAESHGRKNTAAALQSVRLLAAAPGLSSLRLLPLCCYQAGPI